MCEESWEEVARRLLCENEQLREENRKIRDDYEHALTVLEKLKDACI